MLKTFLALLLGVAALPVSAAEPAKCQFARLAEWPVRLQRNLPVVEGAINGNKAGVLLDTGASSSLVTKDAALRLDLFTRGTGQYAIGVGGESTVLATRIRELRIAEATVENMRVRVMGERPIPGVDFILGDDFFRAVDLEFDYAKGMVRVYKPGPGCAKSWLAYWDADALQVPLEDDNHAIIVPVKINGREARALLDSGAASSLVSIAFAEKLGIKPGMPGVLPANCSAGLGAGLVRSWVASFDSLAVGGEIIRDVRLHHLDLSDFNAARGGAPDMILGTDFLRAHHVLVARHQSKLYLSYAGGMVFPATADYGCDERFRAKSAAEGVAAFDQALAENPQDVKALVGRAAMRARIKDLPGAMADLDAALRIEPGNAVALRDRAWIRQALKDYAGALSDTDAAIANGMHVPALFASRAFIRAAQGDFPGALQASEEALRLDPREPTSLRMHGRYSFHAGNFEAAERDFDTRLAVQQSPFDVIWLALARGRQEKDSTAVLEAWLARGDTAWPAPIVQFLAGRIDRDALFAAAAAADPAKRAGQECEARFYVGERLAATGQAAEARALFEKARDECPKDFLEYESATIELSR